MYKHLVTATALLGLSLVESAVQADSREEQRAHHHMQAYLGMHVETAAQGAEEDGGVAILEIQPDGPAARAGLRKGDVITQVGRRVVEDFDDLCNAITRHQPGERVTILAKRDGRERMFQVKMSERAVQRNGRGENDEDDYETKLDRLEDRIQQLADRVGKRGDFNRSRSDVKGAPRSSSYLGVSVRAWAPSRNSRRRPGMAEEGVQVMEIDPYSPAEEAGLRIGDVITAVDGREVATPQELREAMQRVRTRRDITLEVQHGSRQREIRVHLHPRPMAGEDDIRSLRLLTEQIQQYLKSRTREREEFDSSREQTGDAGNFRDISTMEQRLQRLEERIRELEKKR